jgi:DNA-binding transcriptional LysR family regulator
VKLEYLRTLVSIVEQGSLSAAARSKRISQPAVTKQVQRLEAELGLTLLIRGPRRETRLTPAGERVLAFAKETLAGLEALEEDLALLKTPGQGALELAASTIPGEHIMPGLLAAFRARYPQVEVRMTISDTAGVATSLLNKRADVGVLGFAAGQEGLHLERLVGDRIVLIVHPEHEFARREQVSVEELHGEPLVLREEGSGTRQSVEAALAEAGSGLPQDKIALTLGSTQSVVQAVAEGLGLGFVSFRAASQAQASGRVACLGLEGVDLRRDLFLACLPERAGDTLVAHFSEFARAQFEEG